MNDPWRARRLFHRWFIQYNPFYIASAMLVLGGMLLMSRGLAEEGHLYGPLAVAAIAEAYAIALIGGAALLTRLGHRRPAVMLALLTALYQGDLTLHTETCTYLGNVGGIASAVWIALFIAKLYALAWAVNVRVARRTMLTTILGAFGLAILPSALAYVPSSLVAIWLYVLATNYRLEDVTSRVALDEWGTTVLRRTVRAIGALWATLVVFHVAFWSTQHLVNLAVLLPVLLVVSLSLVQSELRLWTLVAAMLLFIAVLTPAQFSVSALLIAIALVRRALAASVTADAPLPLPSKSRLFIGALVAIYLAIWTLGWKGGPCPAHSLALDVAASLAFIALTVRARIALAPLAAGWVHAGIQSGLITAPRSLLAWGGTAITVGFLLLLGSLGLTWFDAFRRTKASTPQ